MIVSYRVILLMAKDIVGENCGLTGTKRPLRFRRMR